MSDPIGVAAAPLVPSLTQTARELLEPSPEFRELPLQPFDGRLECRDAIGSGPRIDRRTSFYMVRRGVALLRQGSSMLASR